VQYSGLNRQGSGNGGEVIVNNSSDISTIGQNAHGIFAQSVSDSGGVIGNAAGTGYAAGGHADSSTCELGYYCGGDVTVNLNSGTIYIGSMGAGGGSGSYGVFAESQGADTSNVLVNVAAGARIIPTGLAGAAVFLSGLGSYGGGGSNTLNNAGVIDATGSTLDVAVHPGSRFRLDDGEQSARRNIRDGRGDATGSQGCTDQQWCRHCRRPRKNRRYLHHREFRSRRKRHAGHRCGSIDRPGGHDHRQW
jgi:hypothetical protein